MRYGVIIHAPRPETRIPARYLGACTLDFLGLDWAGLLPFIAVGFAAQLVDGAMGRPLA